jgi:hypothetical protein
MGRVETFILEPLRQKSWRLFWYNLDRKFNDLTLGLWDLYKRSRFETVGLDEPVVWLRQRGITIFPGGLSDDAAIALFHRYYGVAPRWKEVMEWESDPWNQPTEDRWHRDNVSAMVLNLFTYGADTWVRQGPHIYAMGTHRDPFKRFRPPQPEPPQGYLRTVTGAAGTSFVHVPHGLHRASMVKEGKRVSRQLRLSYYWVPGAIRI